MKNILIFGYGKSGRSVYNYLSKNNNVVIYDDNLNNKIKVGELLNLDFDYVVKSPGIKPSNSLLIKLDERGYKIINDIELAYLINSDDIIAITGTNGKTTTTALVGQLFQDKGRNVVIGGNIGLPLITHVESLNTEDLLVAEVSSFQLESIIDFKPRVARWLLISEKVLYLYAYPLKSI